MLTYLVTSTEDRTIDGLGVFKKDEERRFTEQDVAWFQRCRGVPLHKDNVPTGVTVAILTGVHDVKNNEDGEVI